MILSERNRRTGRYCLNLSLCLLLTACPEDVPVDSRDTTIHLSVVHQGTFSVQLKVSVEDSSYIWTFELTRDDSTVNTVIANEADTIITDGGLNPGQTYRYRAYFLQEGARADSSAEVYANTLDTTSHTFIFEIDTLGNSGSYLNDVAIVDENNIWVVGNIETDSGEYNAARWNGTEWELMGVYSNTLDLYSIWYFSENDIWVTSHCFPYHWDGNVWIRYHLNNMGFPGVCAGNAIWASSPADIWFVGDNGSIVHYDGSGFEKMESGTEVDLKDIDGTPDGEHVFAVGWDNNLPAPSTVLELNGLWTALYYIEGAGPSEGNVGWVWGVDVLPDTVYLSTEGGLWKFNYNTQESTIIPNNISYMNMSAFKNVHGQSVNDIFFAGSGFKYNHFNGNSYFYSQEITDMYPQRAMMGSDYKNNLIVMVGYFNWWEGALIAKGYHE